MSDQRKGGPDQDPALTTHCPTCSADPGELCRSRQGYTVASHDRRFAAYLEKRGNP